MAQAATPVGDEIVDTHEISFQRTTASVAQQRNRPVLAAAFGDRRRHQRLPVAPTENIIAKRKRAAKVVLFHDPGRPQTACIQPILNMGVFPRAILTP
jgi:hypothetical protein